MWKRLTEWLDRLATGRHILFAFVASLVLGVAPLTYAVFRIRAHSPDAGPLDMESHYTPDEAYTMIARYGDDVRSFYIWNAFTADTIAPFLFNLTFLFILLALLRRTVGPQSRLRIVPVLLAATSYLADMTENVLLSIVVSRFPERADGLVNAACSVTMLKRAASFSVWGSVVVLALWAGGRLLLRRRA